MVISAISRLETFPTRQASRNPRMPGRLLHALEYPATWGYSPCGDCSRIGFAVADLIRPAESCWSSAPPPVMVREEAREQQPEGS